MSTFAIIAAGGRGERLSSGYAKFETPLLGRPMVLYSLEAFEEAEEIDGIVLVVPPDRVDSWSPGALGRWGVAKAYATVAGGATRQESVRLGLEALEGVTDVVVVHDAARPLVRPDVINAVCKFPPGAVGLVAAVPVTDTIKLVSGATVRSTLKRAHLFSVQTPQAFDFAVLVNAHMSALASRFEATDDASLVEKVGGRIDVVEGDLENIKITYPADILTAEAIMAGRNRG